MADATYLFSITQSDALPEPTIADLPGTGLKVIDATGLLAPKVAVADPVNNVHLIAPAGASQAVMVAAALAYARSQGAAHEGPGGIRLPVGDPSVAVTMVAMAVDE
jgi:hypothetical protein